MNEWVNLILTTISLLIDAFGFFIIPGIIIGLALIILRVIFADIKQKQQRISQKIRYGTTVWENTFMDSLRKTRCMCLNCAKLKPGQADNCPIAQAGFELCKKYNTAYAMTRCPEWAPKKN